VSNTRRVTEDFPASFQKLAALIQFPKPLFACLEPPLSSEKSDPQLPEVEGNRPLRLAVLISNQEQSVQPAAYCPHLWSAPSHPSSWRSMSKSDSCGVNFAPIQSNYHVTQLRNPSSHCQALIHNEDCTRQKS
jgi:hypothetical protein